MKCWMLGDISILQTVYTFIFNWWPNITRKNLSYQNKLWWLIWKGNCCRQDSLIKMICYPDWYEHWGRTIVKTATKENFQMGVARTIYNHIYDQMSHQSGNFGKTLTHTVRGCFHFGLWVLLHFSVFLDWPSTDTSTYGLGPNQFFLFSFSLADSTEKDRCREVQQWVSCNGAERNGNH